MFSGKTEELIRRINEVKLSKLDFEMFKPSIDERYHTQAIVSHNKNSISASAVSSALNILNLHSDTKVVGIDEAQFFDDSLPEVCTTLAGRGVRVIVAGLDMDFQGAPFEPIPALMALAENVTKLHAICVICQAPASFSYRTTSGESRILLGEQDKYEARCRKCFSLPR